MVKLRFELTILGAAVAALCAACSSQPVQSSHGTMPQKTMNVASANFTHEQLLSMARDAGYKPVTRDGKTIFCRKMIPTGSMLPELRCINEESLRFEIMQARRDRQQLNQTPYWNQTGSGN